ncbi:unnamed protein product [Macrosiphum euphorbiae]|uniref:MULE transposase domain-containing protein n=1 Tax=Macrosiphum euphorbiae TaxID=13131 RepID=A0AAV0XPK3_9HEMI|nr:unnamed protein product [Macrosiphum euphorbiae]
MIDFETGLRNAFTAVYPEANIFSCWFHYIQSLQKNIKKLGYTRYKRVLKTKMYAQANYVQLPRFFTYFSSFWIMRKGPECFTVHCQPRRTNNNVERQKQTFQVLHPKMWIFLEHLNNIITKQHTIVGQLASGVPTTRSTKFKYILIQ